MITFTIDEMIPCLKSVETGEIFETEVVRVKRKSVLEKYRKDTGWYVNWSKFPKGVEIYAIVLKGTFDIQGMIAIESDNDAQAIHVVWACTAPQNNIWLYGKKKFAGVGGHLLALASDISIKRGYDGFLWAEAMDEDLFTYYCSNFGALPLPPLNNPYRFMLSDIATKQLREVYNYEWSDSIL